MYLTQQEAFLKQQEKLYGIQKVLKQTNLDLDDITDLIPGLVHLNKTHSLDLTYIDRQSREYMEVNKRDLIIDGKNILLRHVKPESLENAKKLFGHVKFEDPSQVISHFQALRGFPEKDIYKWYFSVKKRFDESLILTISNPINTLGAIQRKVEKIIEENIYIRKNLSKLNTLTKREKEIITLLVRGYNNPQISEKLFIARSTTETHRKNINRKLGFPTYFQLLKFAQAFELA